MENDLAVVGLWMEFKGVVPSLVPLGLPAFLDSLWLPAIGVTFFVTLGLAADCSSFLCLSILASRESSAFLLIAPYADCIGEDILLR